MTVFIAFDISLILLQWSLFLMFDLHVILIFASSLRSIAYVILRCMRSRYIMGCRRWFWLSVGFALVSFVRFCGSWDGVGLGWLVLVRSSFYRYMIYCVILRNFSA